MGYELHPETPHQGIATADYFRKTDVDVMYRRLAGHAADYGLTLRPAARIPNTRIALQAAEFARDKGHFDQVHTGLFEAYFVDGRDIGEAAVLRNVAEQVGLDPHEMMTAVEDERYVSRLTEARKQGQEAGLTGVPMFLLRRPGQERWTKIVGAQPLDEFRRVLKDTMD